MSTKISSIKIHIPTMISRCDARVHAKHMHTHTLISKCHAYVDSNGKKKYDSVLRGAQPSFRSWAERGRGTDRKRGKERGGRKRESK